MPRQQRNWTWPFLVVLACLFVLSALAPRTWQRLARQQTAEELLAEATARPVARSTVEPVASGVPGHVLALEPALPNRGLAPTTARPAPPTEWPVLPAEPPAPSGAWVMAEASEKLADRPVDAPELPRLASRPEPEEEERWEDQPRVEPVPPDETSEGREVEDDAPESVEHMAHLPSSIERLPRPSFPPQGPPAPLEPAPADDATAGYAVAEARSRWPRPEALLAQLAELAADPETAAWARPIEREIEKLDEAVGVDANEVGRICDRLGEMGREGDRLARQLGMRPSASRLRRTAYALRRRLDIWRETLAVAETIAAVAPPDSQQLAMALARVDEVIGGRTQGRAWREYLLLDALGEVSKPAEPTGNAQRLVARRVLARMAETPLDATQRAFLRSEPFQLLGRELRRMAAEPVDSRRLLECLERYERTRLPSDARALADECMWLALAPTERRLTLVGKITAHWRNANLRVAVTETLLNRLIPERPAEYELVRDVVLGNPVQGESLSESRVAVRLIPDPSRLVLALEITGEVAALTSSRSGPAMFYNTSESTYVARKPMEITTEGIRLWPAEVQRVDNLTQLRSLRTTFDGIPLVGLVAQDVARSQHDMRREELRQEIEQKTAARAKWRIDQEADARLGEVSARLKQRILDPMEKLSLGPALIDAKTTDQRLTMRLRLASRRQLGANTPRPMAPSDSLASFQVHETALENLVERMELDGHSFTVRQLRERIADRLGRAALKEETTSHDDDVEITFAREDAVAITCDEGRIGVTLAIARLSNQARSWSDFQVRVYYRPEVDGLSVELVRDGVVQLTGRRLSTGSQVALRSIFSKIFAKNRSRQITPERLLADPRLADLALTQVTIEDGWIGIALGPRPAAAVARR